MQKVAPVQGKKSSPGTGETGEKAPPLERIGFDCPFALCTGATRLGPQEGEAIGCWRLHGLAQMPPSGDSALPVRSS
jgi:hypothetical protein